MYTNIIEFQNLYEEIKKFDVVYMDNFNIYKRIQTVNQAVWKNQQGG